MCLFSRLLINRKYTKTKKNGGVIPLLTDPRLKYIAAGCGNCIECAKEKARSWQIRILEDIKENKNGKFITLTFSNESIKKLTHDVNNYELVGTKRIKCKRNLKGYVLDNAIAKRAMRLFNERWRKKYGKAIRHWAVTELGHNGTENIHLHGIVWTNKIINKEGQLRDQMEDLTTIWQYGHVWDGQEINGKKINYVNEATAGYITKYVSKKDLKHKHYKPIILTSPGIGSNYVKGYDWKNNKFIPKETNETYKTRTGHKIKLPIYWRNKIYTEQEREKLWIEKLDKEERWVCGEKVSIKNGQQEYEELTRWHRQKSKKLGYGSDEKNYDEVEYEHQRRIIQQLTRIQNAERKAA